VNPPLFSARLRTKEKEKEAGKTERENEQGRAEMTQWSVESGISGESERNRERERERSIPMERRRPFSREGYIEKYIRACNSGEAACICRRARSQRE